MPGKQTPYIIKLPHEGVALKIPDTSIDPDEAVRRYYQDKTWVGNTLDGIMSTVAKAPDIVLDTRLSDTVKKAKLGERFINGAKGMWYSSAAAAMRVVKDVHQLNEYIYRNQPIPENVVRGIYGLFSPVGDKTAFWREPDPNEAYKQAYIQKEIDAFNHKAALISGYTDVKPLADIASEEGMTKMAISMLDPRRIAVGIGQQIPILAGQIGLAALGAPGLAAVSGGGLEGIVAYNEALGNMRRHPYGTPHPGAKKGVPLEEVPAGPYQEGAKMRALAVGAVTGSVSGLLDKLSLDTLGKVWWKQGAKGVSKEATGKAAKALAAKEARKQIAKQTVFKQGAKIAGAGLVEGSGETISEMIQVVSSYVVDALPEEAELKDELINSLEAFWPAFFGAAGGPTARFGMQWKRGVFGRNFKAENERQAFIRSMLIGAGASAPRKAFNLAINRLQEAGKGQHILSIIADEGDPNLSEMTRDIEFTKEEEQIIRDAFEEAGLQGSKYYLDLFKETAGKKRSAREADWRLQDALMGDGYTEEQVDAYAEAYFSEMGDGSPALKDVYTKLRALLPHVRNNRDRSLIASILTARLNRKAMSEMRRIEDVFAEFQEGSFDFMQQMASNDLVLARTKDGFKLVPRSYVGQSVTYGTGVELPGHQGVPILSSDKTLSVEEPLIGLDLTAEAQEALQDFLDDYDPELPSDYETYQAIFGTDPTTPGSGTRLTGILEALQKYNPDLDRLTENDNLTAEDWTAGKDLASILEARDLEEAIPGLTGLLLRFPDANFTRAADRLLPLLKADGVVQSDNLKDALKNPGDAAALQKALREVLLGTAFDGPGMGALTKAMRYSLAHPVKGLAKKFFGDSAADPRLLSMMSATLGVQDDFLSHNLWQLSTTRRFIPRGARRALINASKTNNWLDFVKAMDEAADEFAVSTNPAMSDIEDAATTITDGPATIAALKYYASSGEQREQFRKILGLFPEWLVGSVTWDTLAEEDLKNKRGTWAGGRAGHKIKLGPEKMYHRSKTLAHELLHALHSYGMDYADLESIMEIATRFGQAMRKNGVDVDETKIDTPHELFAIVGAEYLLNKAGVTLAGSRQGRDATVLDNLNKEDRKAIEAIVEASMKRLNDNTLSAKQAKTITNPGTIIKAFGLFEGLHKNLYDTDKSVVRFAFQDNGDGGVLTAFHSDGGKEDVDVAADQMDGVRYLLYSPEGNFDLIRFFNSAEDTELGQEVVRRREKGERERAAKGKPKKKKKAGPVEEGDASDEVVLADEPGMDFVEVPDSAPLGKMMAEAKGSWRLVVQTLQEMEGGEVDPNYEQLFGSMKFVQQQLVAQKHKDPNLAPSTRRKYNRLLIRMDAAGEGAFSEYGRRLRAVRTIREMQRTIKDLSNVATELSDELLAELTVINPMDYEEVEAFSNRVKEKTKKRWDKIEPVITSLMYNSLIGLGSALIRNPFSNVAYYGYMIPHAATRNKLERVLEKHFGYKPKYEQTEAKRLIHSAMNYQKEAKEAAYKALFTLESTPMDTAWDKITEDSRNAIEYMAMSVAKNLAKKHGWDEINAEVTGERIGKGMTMITRALRAGDIYFKVLAMSAMRDAMHDTLAQIGDTNPGARLQLLEVWKDRLQTSDTFKAEIEQMLAEADTANDVDQVINRISMRYAEYMTFQESPGVMAQMMVAARDLHPVGGYILRIIFPFIQISANLLRRGMSYMPVAGYVANVPIEIKKEISYRNAKGVKGKEGARAYAEAMYGNPYGEDFLDITLRQVEGLMMMGLVGTLYSAGMITGAAPDDPEERAAFYAAGKVPYGFKVPILNSYISYRGIGEPFSLALMMMTDSIQTLDEKIKAQDDVYGKELVTFDTAFDLAAEGSRGLLEMSFFGRTLDMTRSNYGIKRFFADKARNVLPYSGVLREIARADGALKEGNTVGQMFAANVPMLRNRVPDKLDSFGDPIQLHPGGPFGLFREWLPDVSEEKPDVVEKELLRVGYYPGVPLANGVITLKEGTDNRVRVADDLRFEYARRYGADLKAQLYKIMRTPHYKQLSVEKQEKILKRAKERVSTRHLNNLRKYLIPQAKAGKIRVFSGDSSS